MNNPSHLQRIPETENSALIRVVGIGGGGGNAVNRMIEADITGVEFVAVNTDFQDLMANKAATRVAIGERATRGLGSGANPEIGAKAAEESVEELHEILSGSDMVFVTATMGGGTGTGASPVIAKVAREEGALTIGVVTKPFTFEGPHKMRAAETGIERLKEHVDTLIVIPNDKLLETADKRMSLKDSFKMADDVLRQGIQGISELITTPGLINLDFADVQTIMSMGGAALMAIGHGRGENRAFLAAEQALASQLLDVTIDGAQGILFNVTGGSDLSLFEINQAASLIKETAHPDVHMIFGAVVDESMGEEIRITVIATGFEHNASTLRKMGRPEAAHTTNTYVRPSPPRPTSTPDPAVKNIEQRSQNTGNRSSRMPMDSIDIPAFLRYNKNKDS